MKPRLGQGRQVLNEKLNFLCLHCLVNPLYSQQKNQFHNNPKI